MIAEPTVTVRNCTNCQLRFLPRPGPCPRCGSADSTPVELSATGRVLAATELLVPPPGFTPPLRLVLAELEDGVRVLGIAPTALPNPGASVRVRPEGNRFVMEPPPRSDG